MRRRLSAAWSIVDETTGEQHRRLVVDVIAEGRGLREWLEAARMEAFAAASAAYDRWRRASDLE